MEKWWLMDNHGDAQPHVFSDDILLKVERIATARVLTL